MAGWKLNRCAFPFDVGSLPSTPVKIPNTPISRGSIRPKDGDSRSEAASCIDSAKEVMAQMPKDVRNAYH